MFVFFESLTDEAREAFLKGNGTHGRFRIDGKYIALEKEGRAMNWILVVKNREGFEPITHKG